MLAVEELIIPLIVLLVIVVVLVVLVLADELLVPAEPELAEELELAIYTQAAPLKAKPM